MELGVYERVFQRCVSACEFHLPFVCCWFRRRWLIMVCVISNTVIRAYEVCMKQMQGRQWLVNKNSRVFTERRM